MTEEEMRQELDEILELESLLNARKAQREAADNKAKINQSGITNLNYGLATFLGLPMDLASGALKLTGVVDPNYVAVGSSESIRDAMRYAGMVLPEEGSTPDGLVARTSRLAGESILPAGGMYSYGLKMATKAPTMLNPLQKSLVAAAQSPKTTAIAEGAAISAGGIGGEVADMYFPDNRNAQMLGELFGSMSPSIATSIIQALPTTKLLTAGAEKVQAARDVLTPQGSRRRAEIRASNLAINPERAIEEVSTESILELDPLTQSGDVGLMSLLKAVENQGQKEGGKFANDIAEITQKSMQRTQQELLGTGDPEKVTEFFDRLFAATGSRATKAISKLAPDSTATDYSSILRQEIESSYNRASNVEDALYAKLPKEGRGDFSNISSKFKEILASRSESAAPEDIPQFVYDLIGKYGKQEADEVVTNPLFNISSTTSKAPKWIPGTSAKNPNLANLKDLRSRLGKAVREEIVKPVPNKRKIQILTQLREEALNTLEGISPEYADAVTYSRELNSRFSQGRIGELLSLERRGAENVTAEGTFDFLTSGNADDIRMGMQQLRKAAPEALPAVEQGLKQMMTSSILTDAGALNVDAAKSFLRNKGVLLEYFPELKRSLELSISTQRLTDELAGANIGNSMSKFTRHKSVASVFLEQDVNKAMATLLNRSSGAGQAKVMRSMINFVKRDKSGEALEGLKSAFGQLVLNTAARGEPGNYSGQAMLKALESFKPAAKQLLTKEELSRFEQVAKELRKIEIRETTSAAEGGIIDDTPNKILSVVSRVGAAQLGRRIAESTGGGTVQTPAIFTGEARQFLENLTNDGASRLLVQAVKDKELLKDLLGKPTAENLRLFREKYRNLIDDVSVGGVQAIEGTAESMGNAVGQERPQPNQPEASRRDELRRLAEELAKQEASQGN